VKKVEKARQAALEHDPKLLLRRRREAMNRVVAADII
jgi:hypothetical protein